VTVIDHPRLITAFSRKPLNMSYVYGDTKDSLANREGFLRELGIDFRGLVCAKQVHGSRAAYVTAKDKGKGALSYAESLCDTVALITDSADLPVAIFTADCLSVFLYDTAHHALGLIHAGWRSTQKKITSVTLGMMRERFRTQPNEVLAGFGPAMRGCCLQVGEEFKDFFSEGLQFRNARYYLDLAGINKKELLESGVPGSNIFDPEICTSCQNGKYFSFRREGGSCGRMISVAMLT
jgi:polyphenol oxidase